MAELDTETKEVKNEAEKIFEEIKGGNWEKFVRLQFESAMKKQVGKDPYDRRTTLLKSMVIDLLIKREFIKERGETEQTICVVTATKDSSSLINDGGYPEKPVYKEYGFLSKGYACTYYLDQKKIRGELGLDCSELRIFYKEKRIE